MGVVVSVVGAGVALCVSVSVVCSCVSGTNFYKKKHVNYPHKHSDAYIIMQQLPFLLSTQTITPT